MAGFKVLIHDQDEFPLMEEFGFAVQPGTHTFAAVSVTKIKNLADPFKTKCKSPELPFAKYFGYSYSVHACVKQCLFNYLIEKCNCQPLYNITPGVELCSMQDAFDCVYPSMFANIGGYTGLFVGMSFLTVLEFVDFLVMWLIVVVRGPKESREVGDNSNKNSYESDAANFNKSTEVINMYT
ncbi:hypothetical protein QZH41_009755 [Actinostola sp. cb2023]|nr:hypothetical protein QZH41_009755 [Actinostola sp. cb2023]